MMFPNFKTKVIVFWLVLISMYFTACNEAKNTTPKSETSTLTEQKNKRPKTVLNQDFNTYWYAGKAEISSYKLEQMRYGEIREGEAVLIYVTEDFTPNTQVKSDAYNANNIPVLKLNATKNFITGMYPYSIMQSTFYPVANTSHALKISTSIQEWCGHVYTQLNNRSEFEITSHSYFQKEGDKQFTLEKSITENELWTKLRVNPTSLPIGTIKIIPSLEYLRLNHLPIKAYTAKATLKKSKYTIQYPKLNRTLTLNFNTDFPHEILNWTVHKSVTNFTTETLIARATRLKTVRSPYWIKNHNSDQILRDTLILKMP